MKVPRILCSSKWQAVLLGVFLTSLFIWFGKVTPDKGLLLIEVLLMTGIAGTAFEDGLKRK